MPELLQGRQDLVLEVAGEQRVLRLQRGDRVGGVGAPDRLRRRLGEPEVARPCRRRPARPWRRRSPRSGRSGRRGAGSRGRCGRRRGAGARRRRPTRTYSGRPLMPTRVPSGRRSLPNLVASWTSSRRPAMALPTSCSLVNGPYMSAVSRKLTPRSRARWMVAIPVGLVAGAVELRHAHAAQAEGRDGERGRGAEGALGEGSCPQSTRSPRSRRVEGLRRGRAPGARTASVAYGPPTCAASDASSAGAAGTRAANASASSCGS